MSDDRKPIPISDLEEIAIFRAELGIAAKLEAQGMSHAEAMHAVWNDEQEAALQRKRAKASKKWNGLCPDGRHGLDFEGQACDLCAKARGDR